MNKLKLFAMNLSKKSLIFRNIARKSLYIIKIAKYKLEGLFCKVDEKTIVFSCFAGTTYTCSPKAIYEYMITDKKYKDFKYVWFFKNVEKYKFLEENKNTEVVKYGSKKYHHYMHIAKYWIFNFKIADYLVPKKNQVFLQCWHGTPLKRLRV